MPLPASHSEIERPTELTLRVDPRATAERSWSYFVAGRRLLADVPLAPLAPFALDDAGSGCLGVAAVAPPTAPDAPFFKGPGWVGARLTEVACARIGDAYAVRVAGLPALLADRRGCRVMPEGDASVVLTEVLVEALLGPGLILPLALAGTFALHAGAVARDGRACLLLGESGAGKSTIARALAAAPGFTLLADDVLPVEADPSGLLALPHYPQLKVPAAAQWQLTAPARVPVAAIAVLAPDASGAGAVTMERMALREAFLALSRHTVAARLFDAPLLAAHAAFCSAALESAPVFRLSFPRRLDALPTMVEALAALLG